MRKRLVGAEIAGKRSRGRTVNIKFAWSCEPASRMGHRGDAYAMYYAHDANAWKCPKCSEENRRGDLTCNNCSQEIMEIDYFSHC